MYKYVNKKTGATFVSSVICKGGEWEQEKAKETAPAKPAKPEPEDKEPEIEEPKKGKKEGK